MIYDADNRPLRRAIGFERAMTKLSDEKTDAIGSQIISVEEGESQGAGAPAPRE
jgi:hypothetical protein